MKTTALYKDATDFEAVYQVVDEAGWTRVDRSGLVVRAVFMLSASDAVLTRTCESPSSDTGVGACRFADLAVSGWFSTTTDVGVAVVITAAARDADAQSPWLARLFRG